VAACSSAWLTINGLLPTAIGLLLKTGGRVRLQAGGIFVHAVLGIMLCYAWRSLLISFGQLNTVQVRDHRTDWNDALLRRSTALNGRRSGAVKTNA
jgi:hypothetical protein